MVCGCSTGEERQSAAPAANAAAAPAAAAAPVVLTEAFLTPLVPGDANIDSVDVWRNGSPALLIATAKTGNVLHVYDASTGKPITTFGTPGTALGQLARPNGILVLDDYAFVVERDNHRLQVFSLPSGKPLLTFGETQLRRPYGITGYPEGTGYTLFVTDNYEQPDGTYPPDAQLNARVHRFRVSRGPSGLAAVHEAAFGETSGDGRLRKVETIAADPQERRVLIAEEDLAIRSLRIYTPDGRFTGTSIGGWFATEPEGVGLYTCGAAGYWIATDQHDQTAKNVFHVFDRKTLAHVGAFRGATTNTTDGVAVTVGTLGSLEGGGFYALHADAQVAAFSWNTIARALSLEICAAAE